MINKETIKSLNTFFATTSLTAKSGKTLVVQSDGTGGNGFTHWRSVEIGDKLVASLANSRGSKTYIVKIPNDDSGTLFNSTEHEFPNI